MDSRSVYADNQQSSSFQSIGTTFAPAVTMASSSHFAMSSAIDVALGLASSVSFQFRSGVAINSSTAAATSSPPPPPPPPPPPSPSPSGSGAGGASGPPASPTVTGVTFSGRAYPLSTVTLLKDAQIAASTIAGPDAKFQVSLTGLSAGSYTFSLYGEDAKGVRSTLFTFPIVVSHGATAVVSGIFISPTISVDKEQVRRGDDITMFGQTAPQSDVTLEVNSPQTLFVRTSADTDGVYLYQFDTSPLENGGHTTKAKASLSGIVSGFSNTVGFVVGDTTVTSTQPGTACKKADVNCDGRVNLVDFSIAAYWYKRTLKTDFIPIEAQRLSGDGKVDLVDFSIMAYYWSG